jgi:hypothetical protein
MAAPAVLTNPHSTDRWTPSTLVGLDLVGDVELAEFVASAPRMARPERHPQPGPRP